MVCHQNEPCLENIPHGTCTRRGCYKVSAYFSSIRVFTVATLPRIDFSSRQRPWHTCRRSSINNNYFTGIIIREADGYSFLWICLSDRVLSSSSLTLPIFSALGYINHDDQKARKPIYCICPCYAVFAEQIAC